MTQKLHSKKYIKRLHARLLEGLELQQHNRNDEAEHIFHEVLAQAPHHPAALYSLAVIAIQRNEIDAAWQFTSQGVAHTLDFAPLWFAHAEVLQRLERREEALASYDKALALNPEYSEALINSGVLLRQLQRHHAALERFNQVLALDPDSENALSNCAIILSEFKEHETAAKFFTRLLRVAPDYHYALGLLCYERMRMCDWTDFNTTVAQIEQGVRAGQRVCKTFALMSLNDNAADHYHAARIFAAQYAPRQTINYWNGEHYQHERIRIAYVSPDLREHPVGHLTAGIFEYHDKTRFETIAISLGIDDNSRIRARMLAAFEHFIDARMMTPHQIAKLLRELEVDIVIDLAGYTSDARIEIYGYRPAPVLVTYLGYPGTLGTDYFDYLIADPWIIPPEHRQFYSEQIVYLPHCYLPMDASLVVSDPGPSRAECGLPLHGFVFCSFSQAYKINPVLFGIWMRLLAGVPNSILWLAGQNETVCNNLRQSAQQHGIDPQRLIFAQRLPKVEDHLARYRHADVFLDTHPYNAHSTTADALFMGLPVVTWMGNSFPARVAGSLLTTLGLTELIADDAAGYEALALELASHPERLAAIRQRIIATRETRQALFNTEGFCRNLEQLYVDMWRKAAGLIDSMPALSPPVTPTSLPVHSAATAVELQPATAIIPPTRSLDLTVGASVFANPFNADEVIGLPAQFDLILESLPYAAASVDYVIAQNVLHRIPRLLYAPERRYPFISLMQDIYRVLKSGGQCFITTPAAPHADVFTDPTAVNIITEHTFAHHFIGRDPMITAAGFHGAFMIESQQWHGAELITVLRKP